MKRISFLLAILLVGCAPKVATNIPVVYPPLGPDEEVIIADPETSQPENAIHIGTISVSDKGYTANKFNSYDDVLNVLKDRARQVGGNVVRILHHGSPDANLSMHKVVAEILKVDDPSIMRAAPLEEIASSHPDYAIIHFYRDAEFGKSVIYDVYLGDNPVYRAYLDSRAEVRINKSGEVEFWARTEAKSTLKIDVKLGRDYYVRCDAAKGSVLVRPSLELVPPSSARAFLNSTKSEVQEADDSGRRVIEKTNSFRVAIHGGASYRTTGTYVCPVNDTYALDSYINKMKYGVSFGADAIYYFIDNIGVGVKFHQFHTGNKKYGHYEAGSDVVSTVLQDRIRFTFIGPIVSTRLLSEAKRNAIIINAGLGSMSFHDNGKFSDPYVISNRALGFVVSAGYDYGLTKNLSIGIEGSLYATKFTKNYKVSYSRAHLIDAEAYDPQRMLDLSFGLRYNF